MLKLTVPACAEQYDEVHNCFLPGTEEQTLELEHSLSAIAEWEGTWHKPFLGRAEKTVEETVDYVRCMTLTPNVDPRIYTALTPKQLSQVNAYIEAPQTATTFSQNSRPPGGEVITAEIIYYWMVYHGIPFTCEHWHLSRLLTLINVCNVKSAGPKKMTQQEVMARNRSLNAARRKKLNTKG